MHSPSMALARWILLAALAAGLQAAEPAWGPATGSMAQAFALPDQNGNVRPLSSLLQENGAVVVFFRSSDW